MVLVIRASTALCFALAFKIMSTSEVDSQEEDSEKYFSLKPTPALAFFPCTETVPSSNPQDEAAAVSVGENAKNAQANACTEKYMMVLRTELAAGKGVLKPQRRRSQTG